MHWRTYERLREQARAADDDAESLLAQSMPGFKELLALSGIVDPPPPRRNANAGAAMARPSIPRPPALHQLHLCRTGSIGPERRHPRRGIMMRLMQSLVPTQEHCGPVSVVHVELGPSGPMAPRSGNMSFSHHPTRTINSIPVAASFLLQSERVCIF
jgi:hypothetical protein